MNEEQAQKQLNRALEELKGLHKENYKRAKAFNEKRALRTGPSVRRMYAIIANELTAHTLKPFKDVTEGDVIGLLKQWKEQMKASSYDRRLGYLKSFLRDVWDGYPARWLASFKQSRTQTFQRIFPMRQPFT